MSDEYMPMPSSPKHQYTGEYIGVVETGVHDTFLRVQIRVKPLFLGAVAADLPWATYRLPPGSRLNDGFFTPVKKDDIVWVDFPFDADTRRPRITGSVHYCPGQNPNFPDEAWSGPSPCAPLHTGLESSVPRTRIGSAGLPCIYKQDGICVEILPPDDADNSTPKDTASGVIRVTNINSGSNIEIGKNGAVTIHANGSLFLSTKANQENAIHGDSDITILNDLNQSVLGNATQNTKGSHNISGLVSLNISSDAKITINAPMVEIN